MKSKYQNPKIIKRKSNENREIENRNNVTIKIEIVKS